MNLASAIPHDDLLLAQLAVAKLAKVMQGIMSVGVASLELDAPADFLAGKDQVLLGFLEVLRCIGLRPGHAGQMELLRRPVDELADLARQFHRAFLALAQWRTLSPEDTRQAARRLTECYAQFFRALEGFAALLGMDVDYAAKAQQGTIPTEEFIRNLSGVSATGR